MCRGAAVQQALASVAAGHKIPAFRDRTVYRGRLLSIAVTAVPAQKTATDRVVAYWLIATAVMILLMVVIGGVTRLTESGLSITEWKPVTGTLPPLGEAAWNDAFTKYQQIPEYTEIHRGMSLDEFKGIFFWEYLHRLWGPHDRPGSAAAAGRVPGPGPGQGRRRAQADRRAVPGGAARRPWLVYGRKRPVGPHQRQPISPDRASDAGGSRSTAIWSGSPPTFCVASRSGSKAIGSRNSAGPRG